MQSWRENFNPKFCAILASLYFNETIEKEPTDKDEKQEVACTYSHADSVQSLQKVDLKWLQFQADISLTPEKKWVVFETDLKIDLAKSDLQLKRGCHSN